MSVGGYKFTQEEFMKWVLEVNRMRKLNELLNNTKLKEPFILDTDGAPPKEDWWYSSVIGMLLYLTKNYIYQRLTLICIIVHNLLIKPRNRMRKTWSKYYGIFKGPGQRVWYTHQQEVNFYIDT